MADSFNCNVITPLAKVLDEQVTYASIPAWDGLLGVEAGRAPIVVKLGDGPLRLDFADGKSKSYFLAGGFAQMKGNKLSLLSEEAIPAEKIDAKTAEAALKEAQARKATTDEEVTRRDREETRARAMIHLATGH